MGVKVFYHCYGASHTSVVAAAIHIGRFEPGRVPTSREITGLPNFDRVRAAPGTVFKAGYGPAGEEVYFVGFGPGRDIIRRAVFSFLELKGVPPDNYIIIDALDRANLVVKAGGITSRRFGLVRLGRPLVAFGMRLAYRKMLKMVREVQAEVRRRHQRLGHPLQGRLPGAKPDPTAPEPRPDTVHPWPGVP